jgi:hypothetical protein
MKTKEMTREDIKIEERKGQRLVKATTAGTIASVVGGLFFVSFGMVAIAVLALNGGYGVILSKSAWLAIPIFFYLALVLFTLFSLAMGARYLAKNYHCRENLWPWHYLCYELVAILFIVVTVALLMIVKIDPLTHQISF